jgi:hypothetical protein
MFRSTICQYNDINTEQTLLYLSLTEYFIIPSVQKKKKKKKKINIFARRHKMFLNIPQVDNWSTRASFKESRS